MPRKRAPGPAARVRARGVRRAGLPRRRDGRHRRAGRGLQAGALPALPGQARPLPRAARHLLRRDHRQLPRGRSESTARQQAAGRRRRWTPSSTTSPATTGAFRLVFESDLTNEPAVRERVDRVTTECAAMIAARHPRRHRPARRGVPAARRLAGGNGPGQRAVLALGAAARSAQGDGGRAGRGARLARHPRLPAQRRALTTSATRHHRRHPSADNPKEAHVEVKIGVQHAARELIVDTDEDQRDRRAEGRRRPRR